MRLGRRNALWSLLQHCMADSQLQGDFSGREPLYDMHAHKCPQLHQDRRIMPQLLQCSSMPCTDATLWPSGRVHVLHGTSVSTTSYHNLSFTTHPILQEPGATQTPNTPHTRITHNPPVATKAVSPCRTLVDPPPWLSAAQHAQSPCSARLRLLRWLRHSPAPCGLPWLPYPPAAAAASASSPPTQGWSADTPAQQYA